MNILQIIKETEEMEPIRFLNKQEIDRLMEIKNRRQELIEREIWNQY